MYNVHVLIKGVMFWVCVFRQNTYGHYNAWVCSLCCIYLHPMYIRQKVNVLTSYL